MADLIYKKPDGSFVTLPASSAQEAQSLGYVPASAEEANASQQTGQAALEGVARGATLGFGDSFVADIENSMTPQTGGISGLEAQRAKTLEEMRLRKEQNPGAALAGEFGGGLAMSVATGGGPSALVGGGLKGALLEGGLAGLGAVVSETTLDKSPLTMDKMAAGMAGGALAAGGIHGVLTGAGKLVSAGVRKLGGSTLSQTLTDAADAADWKMLSHGNLAWARRNEPFKREILQFGRENGIIHAGAALDSETAQKALDFASKYSEKIASQMNDLEGYVPLKGNNELRSRFTESLKKALDSEYKGRPTFDSAVTEAKTLINKLEQNDSLTWRDAWQVQSDLFKDLAGKDAPPATAQVRESLRQAMRDFVFDEVASGKDQSAKILLAAKGFEPKLKGGIEAIPIKKPTTLDLTEAENTSGPLTVTDVVNNTVEGKPLPSVYQPESNDFYLPGQQSSRPLNVRLGEATPESIFSVPETRQKLMGQVTPEGPSLPVRVPVSTEPANAAEIEAMAKNWQGKPAQTVLLGEGADSAGGLVLEGGPTPGIAQSFREAQNLPPMKTPAWLGAEMRQTGREARAAMALSKALSTRATALEAAAGSSNTTLGTIASLASGNPLPLAGALVGDALKDQAKKRGGFVLGAVLRKLGDSQALDSIANGLQQRVGQVLSTAPAMLGAARLPLEAAFGRGAMGLLEEYVRIANTQDGPAMVSALGLTNETPEELEAVGGRLAAMDALHAAQKDIDHRIDMGISAVLGNKSGPMPKFKSPDTSTFKTRVQQMKQTLADPEKAFQDVPNELMTGAPSTTAELVNRLMLANQFLLTKAPKDPFEGMPKALKPVWEPSAADVSKFYRYVEAVEQPAKMLEKMAHGAFTLEHKEALQAVYPSLYEDMKARMYDRLAQWEKPLPYGKKAMLSQFFGTSVLGLKPGALNIIQQSFGPKSGDASPSQGGSRPDGRETIDADKNALTQAQRIEAKGATPA